MQNLSARVECSIEVLKYAFCVFSSEDAHMYLEPCIQRHAVCGNDVCTTMSNIWDCRHNHPVECDPVPANRHATNTSFPSCVDRVLPPRRLLSPTPSHL